MALYMQPLWKLAADTQDTVAATVGVSIEEFLSNLDTACSRGAMKEDAKSNESAHVARSHAVRVICEAVMKRGSTRNDVIQACIKIRANHTQIECEVYKRKLESHIDGLDVLAVCAACFHRIQDTKKHDILHNKRKVIEIVCEDPTDAVTACFESRGLNMMVIKSILKHSRNCVYKMAELMTQYFGISGVAHRFHNACVDAVSVTREELDSCFKTGKWSSIVVRVGKSTYKNDHTFDAPSYISERLELTVSCTSKKGLRVSNFLDALEQCARIGTFASNVSAGTLAHLMFTHKGLCKKNEWSVPSEELVPEALRRDFHVMSAIQESIPMDGGILWPGDIVELAMSSTDFFKTESCTRRSLAQVANHVVRKCAFELRKDHGYLCGVEYTKSDNPNHTVGHVKLDAGGSARLLRYIRNLLTSMASNKRYLSSQWRPSRSSRKMAFKRKPPTSEAHSVNELES